MELARKHSHFTDAAVQSSDTHFGCKSNQGHVNYKHAGTKF